MIAIQKSLKALLLLTSWLIAASNIFAQKPVIDSSAYNNWSVIEEGLISNNGQYVMYQLHKGMTFQNRDVDNFVVTSTGKKWQRSFGNNKGEFTPDSKYFIYKTGDSIVFAELGTDKTIYLPGIASHTLSPANYLAYKLKSSGRQLMVKNMFNQKTITFSDVDNFRFNQDGDQLIFQTSANANDSTAELKIVNLKTPEKIQTIWKGSNIGNIILDEKNNQIAIETNGPSKEFWIYKQGNESAFKVPIDASAIGKELQMGSIRKFSNDGLRLFINLVEPAGVADPEAVALNVWNYKDQRTQIQQVEFMGADQNYSAVLNILNGKIMRLQENSYISGGPGKYDDTWLFYSGHYQVPGKAYEQERYLVNTLNGAKDNIGEEGMVSPAGKYFIYRDRNKKFFFSKDLNTGEIKNITSNVNTVWSYREPGYYGHGYYRGRIIGWLKNDDGVIIYDEFDIWLADPSGKKPAVNLTNGYGRKNSIVFTLLFRQDEGAVFTVKEKIKLVAFNVKTKENGFYTMSLAKAEDPECLTMGPYAYYLKESSFMGIGFEPRKARDAEMYLLKKGSATESCNLFVTKDFKTFTQLTYNYPEKEYNWMTTSLHEWTTPDGINAQGILYKPENFDPSKKYPVIFYYYTNRSDFLNVYLRPQPSDGSLNLPWYISNGYLVFTPDMRHPDASRVYEQSLNTLTSAAKYVSKFPFIDSTKMGMQGISWGGILTNYFVTKTNMFAAACSASGLGNFFSQYNGINHGGSSQGGYEVTSFNGPGKSLWEDMDWYIKNSPVTNAPNVTSPFLMFETTKDGATPYVNAFELYNACRRLGKKIWMLEYTEADHGVIGRESVDFDIRLQQFFNHYLKGAPAPIWMTKGVPGRLKGIERGLELDQPGVQP